MEADGEGGWAQIEREMGADQGGRWVQMKEGDGN